MQQYFASTIINVVFNVELIIICLLVGTYSMTYIKQLGMDELTLKEWGFEHLVERFKGTYD